MVGSFSLLLSDSMDSCFDSFTTVDSFRLLTRVSTTNLKRQGTDIIIYNI